MMFNSVGGKFIKCFVKEDLKLWEAGILRNLDLIPQL